MRKKKRTNTIVRLHKYSVSTDLRPMPPELWDVARRMRDAWNALICAYPGTKLEILNRAYQVAIKGLKEKTITDKIYKKTISDLNKLKSPCWLEWDAMARAAIQPFGLDYSQGPNVIERFNGCIKAGRTCYPQGSELEHIQIPFVFPGSAAIPVEKLFNNTRRWRIVLESVADNAFENNSQANRRERRMGYLELGLCRHVTIPLRIDFHRQLPPGGFIKRVLLCGRKIPFRGIRWSVLFTVEYPLVESPPETELSVELRIGWTRVADSICVAQWLDSSGRRGALCLSLDASNRADRRTVARRPEWKDWVTDYRQLRDYKDIEFELPEGSEERMKMRERRRRVEERWQSKRRWLYRNFAAWLVRRFSVIYLDDLDIKRIAEAEKTGDLAGGDHWRQIAAPGDLIEMIKDAALGAQRPVQKFSQTSGDFLDKNGLRNVMASGELQVFDPQWNCRGVAEQVHAR